MARVKAHIRRVALIRQSAGNQEDRLDFGRLVIHKESAQATKDGERLELTQREFELLTYLASHAGRVFSRQELMERVWNYEGYVGDVRGVGGQIGEQLELPLGELQSLPVLGGLGTLLVDHQTAKIQAVLLVSRGLPDQRHPADIDVYKRQASRG